MHKTIKNIGELNFSKLPEHKSKGLAILDEGLYTNEPLLEEAHRMSLIAFPVPTSEDCAVMASDWYGCDVFGNRYTRGAMNGLTAKHYNALKEKFCFEPLKDKYPDKESKEKDFDAYLKDLGKSLEYFHYDILKPIEDKYLEGLRERFESNDIIASLLALNINPVLFWYALIWLKDFIDDKTDGAIEYEDTPQESFEQMGLQLSLITDVMAPSKEQWDKRLEASVHDDVVENVVNGELTLKVDGFKKLTISNPVTLRLLGRIVTEFVEKYKNADGTDEYYVLHNLRMARNENDHTNNPILPQSKVLYVPALTKLFLFHKYLKTYLSTYSGDKNLCISDVITDVDGAEGNKAASVDKEWLISRLAWVVGYGDKKRFYDNPRGVKDALKGFNESIVRKLHSDDYMY